MRTPPSPGKWQPRSCWTPNSWQRGHRGRWPSPRSLARQLTSGAHPIGGERALSPPPTHCCRRLPQPHPPFLHEEHYLLHHLASSKQTHRHGALPRHTPQRIRHERHDDVIALSPRVFETLHLRTLAQVISLVGTPLRRLNHNRNEGVRQRNICEDRCQTPQILVIWSVENVADPTCGVKFSWEAVRRTNQQFKPSSLLPGLLPYCLHRIMRH